MNIIRTKEVLNGNGISVMEKSYDAKWVMDTEYDGRLVSLYRSKKRHPVSKSKYFLLYHSDEGVMLTGPHDVQKQKIQAVMAANGDLIYSVYRHHYHMSPDGSVFIDGGREYTRTNMDAVLYTLEVKKGKLVCKI